MPDTPTLILVHSETRELLQGAQQSANALQTELKLIPASSLPNSRRTLATFLEWSRLQDAEGIGYFFLTNGAVYIDNISPTVCSTSADAVRCARHELEQLELRDLSDLLEFVADDTRKPAADDFAQTVAVHTNPSMRNRLLSLRGLSSPRASSSGSIPSTQKRSSRPSSPTMLYGPSTARKPPRSRVLAALLLPS